MIGGSIASMIASVASVQAHKSAERSMHLQIDEYSRVISDNLDPPFRRTWSAERYVCSCECFFDARTRGYYMDHRFPCQYGPGYVPAKRAPKINCRNCGAPPNGHTCAYCGTVV